MKPAAILSFSEQGEALSARIARAISGEYVVSQHRVRGNLKRLTEELFPRSDALIFVGACGVAVRAIAPHVKDKTRDPAVVVVDERGAHVVSLLSGHIGGANELARRIAAEIRGEAVITTATDVNGRFSVDAWAARQGLTLDSMRAAKRFSAEILARDLPVYLDFPWAGALPEGVFLGAQGDVGAAVTCRRIAPFSTTLRLIPPILHLGIGCKRGMTAQRIGAAVESALEEARLDCRAVSRAASIDAKRDEPGLADFCRARGWPLRFYSAAELNGTSGEFSASEFVRKTVGVDNVCERSAMCSAGAGAKLLLPKRCMDGVTVAVAQQDWRVSFE